MADQYDALRKSATYAEEAFVVDIQSFLQTLMDEKGFSRSQLADAMGVSRARVSQMFSSECKNFTVRLLARAVAAMDDFPSISCETMEKKRQQERVRHVQAVIGGYENVVPCWEFSPSTRNYMFGLLEVSGDSLHCHDAEELVANAMKRAEPLARVA